MRINTNVSAMNTWRSLTQTDFGMSKSLQRLSSGYRINTAADDAAGLAISEKLRAQAKGLRQATRNAQDAISLIGTAEGALTETESILQRMRELSVQASSDTLTSDDRSQIQEEVDALIEEIDRISSDTQFNTKNLLAGSFTTSLDATSGLQQGDAASVSAGPVVSKLDVSGAMSDRSFTITADTSAGSVTLTDTAGSSQEITLSDMTTTSAATQTLNFSDFGIKISLSGYNADTDVASAEVIADTLGGYGTIVTATTGGSAKFQVGSNASDEISLSIDNMSATALSVNAVSMTSQAGASAAITSIDDAIDAVSTQRAKLGAVQNRLEHTIANLGVAAENLEAADSRIRDVDMALEMVSFTKNQILMQAGTAMMAQANQKSQGVLQLLR